MEVTSTSETTVNIYQSTLSHWNWADVLHRHRSEKFFSHEPDIIWAILIWFIRPIINLLNAKHLFISEFIRYLANYYSLSQWASQSVIQSASLSFIVQHSSLQPNSYSLTNKAIIQPDIQKDTHFFHLFSEAVIQPYSYSLTNKVIIQPDVQQVTYFLHLFSKAAIQPNSYFLTNKAIIQPDIQEATHFLHLFSKAVIQPNSYSLTNKAIIQPDIQQATHFLHLFSKAVI